MSKEELKPCPKCGCEDIRIGHIVGSYWRDVWCYNCGEDSKITVSGTKRAIAKWNTRAGEQDSER
jgi:Lar family restriction alleviation protein